MFTLAYNSPELTPIDTTHLRVTEASGTVNPFLLSTYTTYNGGSEWVLDNVPMAEVHIFKNNDTYTLEWGWTGGRYKYVGSNPWENSWTPEIDEEDTEEYPTFGTAINVIPYIP